MIDLLNIVFLVAVFPFRTLNVSCCFLLVCRVPADKSAASLIYITSCFSLTAFLTRFIYFIILTVSGSPLLHAELSLVSLGEAVRCSTQVSLRWLLLFRAWALAHRLSSSGALA